MSTTLKEFIERIKPRIDEMIKESLKGEPEVLYKASAHLPLVGGKRLRPAMVLIIAQGLGASFDDSLPAATSVELLHNFTLVHDDIMDRDEKRRGVPTVHVIYGEPMAILAGDVLYAKAYEVLLRSPQRSEIVVEMTKTLTWAAVAVAEGQAMDMMFEERWDVKEEEYLKMVEKKTGALFAASAALGGLAAEALELKDKLMELGKIIGIAFQIKDDILSLIGDEKITGKKKYNDLKEGKKTLLVIKALERASTDEKEYLMKVLGNDNATFEELERASEIIIKLGALDYVVKKAEEIGKRAIQIIDELPIVDKEYSHLLKELVEFAVRREY